MQHSNALSPLACCEVGNLHPPTVAAGRWCVMKFSHAAVQPATRMLGRAGLGEEPLTRTAIDAVHGDYPHRRRQQPERMAEELRVPPGGCGAPELDDRYPQSTRTVFAAGACAAAVRRYSESDVHEQARVLNAQPLVEIVKIGESSPEPLAEADRPLGGIRVLDLTRVIAGRHVARRIRAALSQLPQPSSIQARWRSIRKRSSRCCAASICSDSNPSS